MSLDILSDKHELLAYDLDHDGTRVEFEHAGRYYHVLIPEVFDGGIRRVVRVDDAGDLVYVFVEFVNEHERDGPLGGLIVAGRQADGTHRAAIVHALLQFAKLKLGLVLSVQAPPR